MCRNLNDDTSFAVRGVRQKWMFVWFWRFAFSMPVFILVSLFFGMNDIWYVTIHNTTYILMILSFSLMMTLLLKFQSEFTRQSIRMRIQLWLFISMEAASHLEVSVSECTFDASVNQICKTIIRALWKLHLHFSSQYVWFGDILPWYYY